MRGLNEPEKRTKIRRLLREWNANIVCLQETKMEVISREVVCSVWGCIRMVWVYLGSRGASGGILLMWDRRVVEKIEECVGRYVVACAFRSVIANFIGRLRVVYGHNDDDERRGLWDELVGLMNIWEMPRRIRGDFNIVQSLCERGGKRDHHKQWWSFLILFLNMVSWIFQWSGGDPRGLIAALGPELIDSCSL